nr:MAG TPA: protein of unknown function (DUF5484) [Caudoviricetes sp.]
MSWTPDDWCNFATVAGFLAAVTIVILKGF